MSKTYLKKSVYISLYYTFLAASLNFSTQIIAQNLVLSSGGQTGTSGTNWSTSGTNPNTPNHNKIRDRVVDLLQRAGFEPSTTTVETANVSNTWVTVPVTKQYEPMFKFLATTNIRVHASGPFLSLAP